MRVLIAIAHFFQRAATAAYGSEKGNASARLSALTTALTGLQQTFGYGQSYAGDLLSRCNGRLSTSIDVVVCTTGESHLISDLPEPLFRHHATSAEPRLLGYECHAVLADAIGGYDFYGFMEDDLLLTDPSFFWKVGWFSQTVGADAVLQPHRFELSPKPPVHKLYIDSALRDPTLGARFQDRSKATNLTGWVMGREIGFERPDNPHSGCFFLSAAQMAHWAKQPWFLDRAVDFVGPLESAATLGLMRTFRVYKPIAANAGFLEIQHLDRRYLGSQIQFRKGFSLNSAEGYYFFK